MSRLSRLISKITRSRRERRAGARGVRSEDMEKRILFSADVPWADPFVSVMENEEQPTADQERAQTAQNQDDARTDSHNVMIVADRRMIDVWRSDSSQALSWLQNVEDDISIVESDADAIGELTNLLGQRKNVAQLHLFAAPDRASLTIGNTTFDTDTVLNRAVELTGWRAGLTNDASLSLHTDQTVAQTSWQHGSEAMSALTGARVSLVSPANPQLAVDALAGEPQATDTGEDTKRSIDRNDVRRFNGTAQIVTVTNLLDTVNGDTSSIAALNASQGGDGISLREAILALNEPTNGAGPHHILFNIPGGGPHVIGLSAPLPEIENPVVIDGTSEPDFGGAPMIELRGSGIGTGLALAAGSGGSEIRGLVFNQFSGSAIAIRDGSDGNTIAGNYIGTNVDTTSAFGASILINVQSDNNTIGGATAADRNIISGGTIGVLLQTASGNQIAGNYFGTDASGSAALGSLFEAISLSNASNDNTIGGPTAAEGNVFLDIEFEAIEIASSGGNNTIIQNNSIGLGADGTTVLGTGADSIFVLSAIDGTQIRDNIIAGAGRHAVQFGGSSTNTVIQGNFIGTDSSLSQQWGSGSAGILIQSNAAQFTIGGINAGEGNVIANSGQTDFGAGGIELANNAQQITIRGNSIFGNAGIGIDFEGDGQNANDVDGGNPANTDSDTGTNNLQNYANLVAAGINGSGNFAYQIDTGTLTQGQTYTIDFYASPDPGAGTAQGQRYLGTATGINGSSGNLVASIPGVDLEQGEFITLTVTDSAGNTSEFSNSVVAYSTPPYNLRVTETTGGGLELNANGSNASYLIADDGDALLGGLTAITFETQFAANELAGAVLVSYETATVGNEFVVEVRDNGDLAIVVDDVYNAISSVMDYRTLADGELHTLAVTWDNTAGAWSVVVDGVLIDSNTGQANGRTIAAGGTLVIGQEQDTPGAGFDPLQSFSGVLYTTRIYSASLTEAQLAASAGRTIDNDTTSLLAQWNFDALSSNGIVLDGVAGNNLTLASTSGPGFIADTNELTLRINENAPIGTVIGAIAADDDARENRINSLLAADSSLVYNAETNLFYRLSSGAADYATSLSNAAAFSLNGVAGNLASIRSATEQATVQQVAAGFEVYLGGSDSAADGVWRWTGPGGDNVIFWVGDGGGYAPSDAYSNWRSARPDGGAAQPFLRMTSTGTWDDEDGTTSYFSILAWDADEVLDASSPLTYTIVGQPVADALVIDADTGLLTVDDPSALDFESNNPYTITVRATDVTGYTADQTFDIQLNDVDESGNPPLALTSGIEINADGGNDAYLETTDAGAILGGLTAFTFETTIAASEMDDGLVLASYATTGVADTLSISVRSDGALHFWLNSTQAVLTGIDYADRLVDGQVHQFALTWDAQQGAVAVYIDGELVERQTGLFTGNTLLGNASDGTLIFAQEQDSFGGGFSPSETFRGTLYDVRIWDHARSDAQISQNTGREISASPTEAASIGLLANWQMDGFNGSDQVVDSVGGANLSRGQAVGAGFVASAMVGDLNVNENSANGTVVGFVTPATSPTLTDVVADGRFLEAADPGGSQSYATGTSIGSWFVQNGSVDLNGAGFEATPNAGRSIDLNGSDPGAITQTFDVVPGQTYQITFALSGNFDGGSTTKEVRVSAGSTSEEFSFSQPPGWSWGNMQWETRTLTFVATSDTVSLSFESLSASDFVGAVVGDIQVFAIPQAISEILAADPSLSYDALTDKFYRVVDTPGDISAALVGSNSATINDVVGQLVTIRSLYENDLIVQLADGASGPLYIGATDSTVEGTWNWLSNGVDDDTFWIGDENGAPAAGAYANWTPGEPDSSGGGTDEDYAAFDSSTGQWFDVSGLPSYGYVVEWDASEVIQPYTYTLTDSADGRFAIDANTGAIRVADASRIDFEDIDSHTVVVRAEDARGQSRSESFSVVVNNVAEPTAVVPAAQTVLEDSPLTLDGTDAITVTDGVAGDTRLRVALSIGHGTLTLSTQANITFVEGADGSPAMVIEGLESDLNTALDGLRFTPFSDQTGSDTLNIDVTLADLALLYTFENDIAIDTSDGPAYNGTLTGDAFIANDAQRGNVLNLDGDGDYIEIQGLVGEPSEITLAGWINASAADSSGAVVISLGTSPALYLEPDGRLTGFYESGGTLYRATSQQSLIDTGWRHVAMTIDSTTQELTIFIDGVAVETLSTPLPVEYDRSPNTFIGRAGDGVGDYDFDGQLDDIRVYSRALSASEMRALATDSAASSETVSITVNEVNDPPTFDVGDGAAINPLSTQYDGALDVAVLPDGRYLVLGAAANGSGVEFTLTRYNVDGSIDTSFGSSGTGTSRTLLNSSPATPSAMAIQDDGRIVVVGNYRPTGTPDSIVLRFDADGELDATFGTGGIVTIDLSVPSTDRLNDVAIDSEGRIVATGYGADGDDSLYVTRLTTSGALDGDFGTGGIVSYSIPTGDARGNALALQSDGRIVVAGQTGAFGSFDGLLLRLLDDGSFDPSFNSGNVVTLDLGGTEGFSGLGIDSLGRLVAAGWTNAAGSGDSMVARFDQDGALDGTFGSGGIATVALGSPFENVNDLALQSDGRIVVVGDAYNGSNNDVSVFRLTEDGNLDTTFNDGGSLRQPLGSGTDSARRVTIAPNGQLLVVGNTVVDGQGASFLMRLDQDGQPDRAFNTRNTLDESALFTEDNSAVVLDGDVEIFDRELSALNDFNGATLSLQRDTGANTDDEFGSTGLLSALTEGGALVYNATTVGTVTQNGGGQLILTFNGNATNDIVNNLMQRITYANTNDAPPSSVDIEWRFDDGNGRDTARAMTVTIASVNDAPVIAPDNQIINGDFSAGLEDWATSGTVTLTGLALRFGAGNAEGPHTAAQTFATVAGQVYTVQFDYRDDSVSLSQSVNVRVDGASNLLSQSYFSSASGTTFVTRTLTFVADSASTTLTFTDTSGSSDSVDGYIDNVVVAPLPMLPTVSEDDAISAPISVASLIASVGGDLILDGDSGSVEGVAITGSDATFDYSIDGGATWQRVDTPSSGSALLLRAGDLLRFEPNGVTGGVFDLDFRAWDQTSGTAGDRVSTSSNGGSTAFSSESYQAAINVSSINDAPTFGTPAGFIVANESEAGYNQNPATLVLADGSVIMTPYDSNFDWQIAYYGPDGELNTTIGNNGYFETSAINTSRLGALYQLADGRLLAAGSSGNSFIVAMYNADGTLAVNDFGTNGVATIALAGFQNYLNDMTVQADGSILLAGEVDNNSAIVRLTSTGALDLSFDADGVATFDLAGSFDEFASVNMMPDGRIVAASGDDIVRVNADGSPDTTFDFDGRASVSVGTTVTDTLVQADGSIILVGQSGDDLVAIRLASNGAIDTSFGVGGTFTWADSRVTSATAHAIVQQSDGRLVVAGSAETGSWTTEWVTLRLNANGTLDNSFGDNGAWVAPQGSDFSEAYNVALYDDGGTERIIVSGYSSQFSFAQAMAVRLDPDGSISSAVQSGELDGNPTYFTGGAAVVLDRNVAPFDPELARAQDYSGATLTIERNGGPNSADVFSATGLLGALTEGGALVYDGFTVGTVVSNSGGTLTLQFNNSPEQTAVHRVAQAIAYSFSGTGAPSSVDLVWTFSDGNTGEQGPGGALSATGSTTVNIETMVNAPDTATLLEDASFTFTGADAITVSDGTAGNGVVQVALAATNGTLTLSGLSGLTFVDGADGSATMVIEGAEDNINAALDGLVYTPISNYNGAASVDVRVTIAGSLAGRYTFDGGTLTDTGDAAADNGSFIGDAVIFDDPGRGDVLSLDGTGDSVQISGLFGQPADVTLTAWVQTGSGGEREVLSLGNNIALRVDADNNLVGFVYNASAFEFIASGVALDASWNHVAVTFDSSQNRLSLYLNGALVGSGVVSTGISYSLGTDTFIGSHGDGDPNFDFNGLIDDARIYTRALSADELAALALGESSSADAVAVTVSPVNNAPVINAANLISNGDFETGNLTSWTTIGTVDVAGNELRFGAGDAPGPHRASQGFATVAGQIYSLTFSYRADSTTSPQSLEVSLNGNTTLLSRSYESSSFTTGYVTRTVFFVADSASTTLTFIDTSADSVGVDSYIDNVVVTELPTLPDASEDDLVSAEITVAALLAMVPGDVVTDADAGAVEGVALSTLPGVTFEYSLDGGATWLRLPEVGFNDSLLLRDTDLLRVAPNGVDGGISTLRFRAWDQTTGSAGEIFDATITGGTTALSAETYTLAINIAQINDAPQFGNVPGYLIHNSNDLDYFQNFATLVLDDGSILMTPEDPNFDSQIVYYGPDGEIDTSFGINGVFEASPVPLRSITELFQLDDGRFLAAARSSSEFVVLVYNADGTLDEYFDGDGAVVVPFGSGTVFMDAAALQADGRIVLAGGAENDYVLVRLNSDGSLDTSFSGDGIAALDLDAQSGFFQSVRVQADGRIIAAGNNELVRLNANGTLDTSFSGDGRVAFGFNITDALIQTDGSIVVSGVDGEDLMVARVDSNGTLDSTFGTGGLFRWQDGRVTDVFDSDGDLVQQSDGRLLISGVTETGTFTREMFVLRLNTDGSVDTSFGDNGAWIAPFGADESRAFNLSIFDNAGTEQIILGGATSQFSFAQAVAIRLNPDGTLDTSFGNGQLDGTPTFFAGGAPVVLDSGVVLLDLELSRQGHYAGATLTIERTGGPSNNDTFTATGLLGTLSEAGNLVYDGTVVGTVVTNSGGTLSLLFNDDAEPALVNLVAQSIAYSNTGTDAPSLVDLQWTFSDGNTDEQGPGGPLQAVSSMTVAIERLVTAPATAILDEDDAFTFTGTDAVIVSDGTAGNNIVQVALTVTEGTLSLSGLTGITVIDGTDGSASMVLVGLESDINAALDGMVYTPFADRNGAATLDVAVTTGGDLLGRYTFDDGVTTSSGETPANDGVLFGGASIIDDPVRGDVLSVDGDRDGVQINGLFGQPADVTLAAWVQTSGTGERDVISLGDNIGLRIDATNNVYGFVSNGVDWDFLSSGETIDTGWNHVALTFDSSENRLSLFLNGRQVGSGILSTGIAYTLGTDTFIGAHANGTTSYDFTGLIDDARIYTRALSADEMAAMVHGEPTDSDSVAITINPINDAPTIDLDADNSTASGSNYATSWTQGTGPVNVADNDAAVGDIDSATLASLTVTLTNRPNGAQEFLTADTTGTSIAASYDPVTGVLLLSGPDSAANYQQVLRTLLYDNDSPYPDETARVITFEASDGTDTSVVATTTLAVTATRPAGVTILAGETNATGEQTTVSELAAYVGATYLSHAVAVDAAGNTVVVWTADDPAADGDDLAVMARLFDAAGNALGSEFTVNTTAANAQSNASVAMDNDGNFVVVWTSADQDGDGDGIYAQRFDASGVAQGGEFQVNTTTSGDQQSASIAMAGNGDFVVVWNGEGAGDTSGVFGQRYTANGVAQGAEFRINETTASTQNLPQVAMDDTGNFIVTWSSEGQDGSGRGVFVRSYNAAGNALNAEQQVNTSTAGAQWISSVAVNASGQYVVAWRDDGQVGELYMQLYNPDGSRNGVETQVPSAPAGAANYVRAAIDDAGNVTLVWQDVVDANDYAIVARQFDASGSPLGAQFLVNTNEQLYQELPAIAMTGDGQFVVVFTDYDRYNDGQYTTEMRRFSAVTTETGGTVSFDFVLDTQPTDDVTITLSMPDGTEGTLSTTTLTFTSANWNLAQTVTVTGVDDVLSDGNTTHLLVTSTASSLDARYDGLEVRDVNVTNLDNDPRVDLDGDDSSAAGLDFATTWTQGGGPVAAIDADATLSDPDSNTLSSVVIRITNALDGANETLTADTAGTSITASYDAATGVLTLSGPDTLANYQQVLRTITYDNTASLPQSGTRVLSVVANDTAGGVSTTALSSIATVADQGLLVVTNLNDTVNGDTTSIDALIASQGGDGISLREAILASNNSANGTGSDIIRFDIAGAGPHILNLSAPLPDITDAIFIDGSSEPDFGGTPMVILDGNGVAGNGLTLAAGSGGSEIRGLIIRNFGGNGIEVQAGSDGNLIAGNYIGQLNENGTDAGAGSGNAGSGIVLRDGTTNTTIGGATTGAANIIARNDGAGIRSTGSTGTTNSFLGNRIFDNTGLGIDLGTVGVNPNDPTDADVGPNGLLNFPELATVNSHGGDTTIVGSLEAEPTTTYRIELFSSPSGDALGHGEAATYLGFVTVTTDATGQANFATTLAGVAVPPGHSVTATATEDLGGGAYGATSEFAANRVATDNPPGVAVSILPGPTQTTEAGGTVNVSFVLNAPPTDNVTIALSVSDATEATLSTTTLVFTSTNWDTPQVVTVAGLDDALTDGDIGYLLVTSFTSSTDTRYDGLTVADVALTNLDNDPAVDLDADDSTAPGLDFATTWTEDGGPVNVVDSDAQITTPNGANIDSMVITLTNPLNSAAESLRVDTTGTAIGASYNTATGALTLSGADSAAAYQQVLRTLTYDNDTDAPNTTTRTIAITATSGGQTSALATASVSISAINDAPVLQNNTLTLTQGDVLRLTPANLSATDIDTPPGDLRFEVSALTGGRFELSTNPGVSVTSFTQQALIDGLVRFVDDGDDAAPSYLIAVRDATTATAPQTATIAFTQAVTPNSAPTFTSSATRTVDENTTAAGRITATDTNGDAIALSITGGADADRFTLDTQSGELNFIDAPDYEAQQDADRDGVYQIAVTARDALGAETQNTVNVRVANVNESPDVSDNSVTLNASEALGVIAQVSAIDPDSGDEVRYRLIASPGAEGQFSIDERTGEVRSDSNQLFDGQYQLTVQVVDAGGMTANGTVRVTVLPSQSATLPLPGGLPSGPGTSASGPASTPTTTEATNDSTATTSEASTDETPAPQPAPAPSFDEPSSVTDTLDASEEQSASTIELNIAAALSEFGRGSVNFDTDRPAVQQDQMLELAITIERLLGQFATGNVDDLQRIFDSLTVALPPDLAKTLDQIASDEGALDSQIELRVTGAVVASISLSAGFVVWILRAGSLLGSLLASRPLWTSLDPLPIFWGSDDEKNSDRIR